MNIKTIILSLLITSIVLIAHSLCLAKAVGVGPVIAFSAEGDHGSDSINVYSEATGLRCVLKAPGLFNAGLYGYDAGSDTWLVGTPPFTSHYRRIVEVRGGRRSVIRLSKFPEGGEIQDMVSCPGNLTVSSAKNGRLVLNTYSLDGSPKSTRTLAINGIAVKGASSVSTTRTGFVAAYLTTEDSSGSAVYVFDNHGRVNARINHGGEFEFDPAGRRFAYQECTTSYTTPVPGHGVTFTEAGNIVLYDLTTKSRRAVSEMPPNAAKYITHTGAGTAGLSLTAFHWSADGRGLVCAYTQGEFWEQVFYFVDITSAEPVWRSLPIESCCAGSWTVLDKMPPAHGK